MRKKAAALNYDKAYGTPVVTALGFGQIADKIIETAKASNVPVIVNPELADSLMNLDIGQSIPSELYEAVAEIIAFIYTLNDEMDR